MSRPRGTFRRRGGMAAMVLLGAWLGGCGMPSAGATPREARDVLTRDQMIGANASTVYDAVQKLQPDWLSSHGPVSMTDPTPTVASVYMNGAQVGLEYLRNLRPDDVDRIRYYEAGEASARFGMGHQRGVIEISPRGQV